MHFTLPRLTTFSAAGRVSDTNSPFAQPQRRLAVMLLTLSAVPVLCMLVHAILVVKNIAYWDELDSAVALLLRVRDGAGWSEIVSSLVALTNEHRTLTSRVLFLLNYAATGTVNFTLMGAIGNLCLVGCCVLLVAAAGSTERRIRMVVLLAFLLFSFQHYENFFWAGSSIDHFQVVLLAAAAFTALARASRRSFLAATLFALLATLTLAHGLLVWPIGLALLALRREWRRAAAWAGIAAAATVLFFQEFAFNPHHRVGDFSAAGLGRIAEHWLALLGAPLALGQKALAPFLGVLLLAGFVRVALRRTPAREPLAIPLAAWAIGSLALVAVGRANLADFPIYSRYYVLGGLAWALVLFMEAEFWLNPAKPLRLLVRTVPVLAVFNIAANAQFTDHAKSWVISRDSAAQNFMLHGRDGVGRHTLHPDPAHASRLIRRAEETGVFTMPRFCQEETFAHAKLVADLAYFVDRINVDGDVVSIEGWAAFRGRPVKPGQIHVILRSTASNRTFTTLPVARPDVVEVFPQEPWRDAGFKFLRRRWLLPAEDYQLGLLIHSERGAEFVMTAHRLDLTGAGRAVLANGN